MLRKEIKLYEETTGTAKKGSVEWSSAIQKQAEATKTLGTLTSVWNAHSKALGEVVKPIKEGKTEMELFAQKVKKAKDEFENLVRLKGPDNALTKEAQTKYLGLNLELENVQNYLSNIGKITKTKPIQFKLEDTELPLIIQNFQTLTEQINRISAFKFGADTTDFQKVMKDAGKLSMIGKKNEFDLGKDLEGGMDDAIKNVAVTWETFSESAGLTICN